MLKAIPVRGLRGILPTDTVPAKLFHSAIHSVDERSFDHSISIIMFVLSICDDLCSYFAAFIF